MHNLLLASHQRGPGLRDVETPRRNPFSRPSSITRQFWIAHAHASGFDLIHIHGRRDLMMCRFCHRKWTIWRLQSCNKSVPDSGDRLHKSRALRIVVEDSPNFAYGGIDTVVYIDKNALAPYPVGKRLAGDHFVVLLDEDEQNPQGNALKFHPPPPSAQLQ